MLPSNGRGPQTYVRCSERALNAAIGILESTNSELNVVQSEYSDLDIVLDSGAADHVMSPKAATGYKVTEGAGSKSGGCFVAANGDVIANQGELKLEMRSGDEIIHTTFQAADITKPLWSVSKICQAGYTVMFDKAHATIYHVETGEEVGVFPTRNGLYVGTMRLKNRTFARQDRG